MPTIVAIATPPGKGGIGIIRMSGPGAKSLLARVFLPGSHRFTNFRPWTMHRGVLLDSNDEPLDDVLAVYMPAPRTYTGEDVVEIHCHGGAFLLEAALDSLIRLGARPAEPGEFTRRAYLNGRMDLSQAEAVAELISAPSREAVKQGFDRLEGRLANHVKKVISQLDDLRALARIGLDFPDDEIEGLDSYALSSAVQNIIAAIDLLLKGAARAKLMRDGGMIALVGGVNAGKSSLFNAIVGRNRALVTDIPGTTRDFIEESLDLSGLPVRLVDTAGLRETSEDPVEVLGMEATKRIMADADLICLVLDSQKSVDPALLNCLPEKPGLVAWNKSDLGKHDTASFAWESLSISALTGENIEELVERMRQILLEKTGASEKEAEYAPNVRQSASLAQARYELEGLLTDLQNDLSYDCLVARLDYAAAKMAEVFELAPENELLDKIFTQFCIGK